MYFSTGVKLKEAWPKGSVHTLNMLFHQGAGPVGVDLEVVPLDGGRFGSIVGVRGESADPESNGGACVHGVVGVDWHLVPVS